MKRTRRSAAGRGRGRGSADKTSKGRSRSGTGPLRRTASKSANRRVSKKGEDKDARPAPDPLQRKIRNRTILALTVLGLVNAYVFAWNDEGLSGLGSLEAAAIGHGSGPLPPLAEPRVSACGGDPVRIFEGLEDMLYLETSLTGGYTLRLGMLSLGVPGEDIDRLEAAVRTKVDLSLLGGSGAPLRVALDRHGGVHAVEVELAEGHVLQACKDDSSFSVRNLQHPSRNDVEVLSFELGQDADLENAIEAAGEKPELARLIAETLAQDIDFMTEARPHDKLQVMVEKRWLGRKFHRYGAVLAVRLRGTLRSCAYYRYKPEGGEAGFFDSDGKPMERALLRSPIGFFGVNPEARGMLPPSVEVVEGNIGAAYRLPEGAPLVALGDATVVTVDTTAEEGNFIDLELADGTVARYCHLGRVLGELEAGMKVKQGDIIGLAGHSGRTPHNRLRLELWIEDDGQMATIDPLRRIGDGVERAATVGKPIPDKQLDRFRDDTQPQRSALRLARR